MAGVTIRATNLNGEILTRAIVKIECRVQFKIGKVAASVERRFQKLCLLR